MTDQPNLSFRPLEESDVADVVALWERCGLTRPHNDAERDIAFARGEANSDILLGELGGKLAASVMVGHDGHRGVVYYVSVDPAHQGKGFGQQIMRHAEDWLKKRGVWKLNLMMRAENTKTRAFYEKLGYEVEDRLNMARRILE